MRTTIDPLAHDGAARSWGDDIGAVPPAAALALLSLAAGFLHASVIDAHRGHGIVAGLFTSLAVGQVAWAAIVLARPHRLALLAGAFGNAVVVAGYLASRTTGIPFVAGLEDVEAIGFTDGVATALEVLLVAACAASLAHAPAVRRLPRALSGAGLVALGLGTAAIGVPAAAAGAGHVHDHGVETAASVTGSDHGHAEDDSDHPHGDATANAAAVHAHGDAAVDEGPVSAEQQARADALLADVKDGMWQWTDGEAVYAAGFRSIGDGATGTEHMVNWKWINDDVVLDPDQPESLVYEVTPAGRKLVAAMFMAPSGTPDDQVPDVGGTLTQWHIHNNLCYSPEAMVDGAREHHVVGLTAADGSCSNGDPLRPHAPMLHVWMVDHPCGPFASLEGIGAGQAIVEEGDAEADPACQHSAH